MKVILIYDALCRQLVSDFWQHANKRFVGMQLNFGALEVTEECDLDAGLVDAEYIVTFWSTALAEGRFVRDSPEIYHTLLSKVRVLSIITDSADPPWDLGEFQALKLSSGGDGSGLEVGFSQICDAITEAADPTVQAAGREVRQSMLGAGNEMRAARQHRRRYDFRELSGYLDQASEVVGDFCPDVLFAFDARGGMWGELLLERLKLNVPVIVGFRLKPTGPRKEAGRKLFDCCHLLETTESVRGDSTRRRPRWHLFVPPALLNLSQDKKVLFVDDYTSTGETCAEIKRFLIDERGFPPHNVRTMVLVTTASATAHGKTPDFSFHETPAERADLFYMFRR
jgi:hypoxanthine phosphoribosyltransferase